MPIRLQYDTPGAAGGLAAYYAARGRAQEHERERQQQTALDVWRTQQHNQLQWGLTQQRRGWELADRAEERRFELADAEREHKWSVEAAAAKRTAEDDAIIYGEYDRMAKELDALDKESGGVRPTVGEGWSFWQDVDKYRKKRDDLMADPKWTPGQRARVLLPELQRLLERGKRGTVIVPEKDRPGSEWESGGWIWRNPTKPGEPAVRVRPLDPQKAFNEGVITVTINGRTMQVQPERDRSGNPTGGWVEFKGSGVDDAKRAELIGKWMGYLTPQGGNPADYKDKATAIVDELLGGSGGNSGAAPPAPRPGVAPRPQPSTPQSPALPSPTRPSSPFAPIPNSPPGPVRVEPIPVAPPGPVQVEPIPSPPQPVIYPAPVATAPSGETLDVNNLKPRYYQDGRLVTPAERDASLPHPKTIEEADKLHNTYFITPDGRRLWAP